MMLGQNISLQSLYMLRNNANMRQAGAFSAYERFGAMMVPTTPGFPRRESVFAGRSAGSFHIGSLGSIPRDRMIEAGQLNPAAFALAAIPAPLPQTPSGVPSFGNTPGGARPGQSLDNSVVPQPVPVRVIGRVVPSPAPPIQMSGPTSGPPQSSNMPQLLGGAGVLALLYFGTQDKKKRRR